MNVCDPLWSNWMLVGFTVSTTDAFGLDYMGGMYKRVAGPPTLSIKEFLTKIQYYLYPITPWCSDGTPNPALTVAENTADYSYW